jgi:hypothetical protein
MHTYSVILNENDPQHNQPDKINIALKPHQRCGLYKAKCMEQDEYLYYNVTNPRDVIPYGYNQQPLIHGQFKLRTNIGVIGDIVGYGKTLLALSIIAELKTDKIHYPVMKNYTYHNNYGFLEIIKENNQASILSSLINTTLVIVPRGPVYIQWKNSIKNHTKLKGLSIENLVHIKKLPNTIPALKTYLEGFDIVLIKNTTLQHLISYYREIDHTQEIVGFSRIMVDEAHTIIMRIPEMYYKFLWLITSSYRDLFLFNYSRTLYSGFLQLTQHSMERLHYILIKGEYNFVKNSFDVPPPIEHFHICKMNRNLTAIQPYLSSSVQDKINVNDISGAIRELGGSAETEDALVEAILKDIEKELVNKEREIEFVKSLDLDNDAKESRVKSLQSELNRIITRKESIQERLVEVKNKACSICYDALENPIYLNCSHIFCGQCLFTWIQSNSKTRQSDVPCPQCRTAIDSSKIVAIVKEKTINPVLPMILSKEDKMIDIILKKPHGRFLVFSRMDFTFGRLSEILKNNNITHCEIKGSTTHMMHILEDFNNSKIKVILLNTAHAGFGIDISSATDVIIYHSMPQEKIQAVGRAQRVGRKDTLTIHNLCYPHEVN